MEAIPLGVTYGALIHAFVSAFPQTRMPGFFLSMCIAEPLMAGRFDTGPLPTRITGHSQLNSYCQASRFSPGATRSGPNPCMEERPLISSSGEVRGRDTRNRLSVTSSFHSEDFGDAGGNPASRSALLNEITGDPTWHPTFVFYMGYPKLSAHASLRRPVQAVIV